MKLHKSPRLYPRMHPIRRLFDAPMWQPSQSISQPKDARGPHLPMALRLSRGNPCANLLVDLHYYSHISSICNNPDQMLVDIFSRVPNSRDVLKTFLLCQAVSFVL